MQNWVGVQYPGVSAMWNLWAGKMVSHTIIHYTVFQPSGSSVDVSNGRFCKTSFQTILTKWPLPGQTRSSTPEKKRLQIVPCVTWYGLHLYYSGHHISISWIHALWMTAAACRPCRCYLFYEESLVDFKKWSIIEGLFICALLKKENH